MNYKDFIYSLSNVEMLKFSKEEEMRIFCVPFNAVNDLIDFFRVQI